MRNCKKKQQRQKKYLWRGIFPILKFVFFLNLGKIYSAEFFLIFPVSSSVCNKKIFMEKYGVTGLVFKKDAIDSKKWVKFVAVQQDSATLIYDLNTMKSTVESYIKKNSAAIQNSTVLSLKNRTEFYKSQKKTKKKNRKLFY